MLTLLFAAQAAPIAGGFVGAHLAGPNHELYRPADHEHAPLGASLLVGGRLGYIVADHLLLEVEGGLGPAVQAGGLITGFRAHGGLLGPEMAKVVPGLLAGGGTLGIASPTLGNDTDLAFHVGPMATYALTDTLSLRADVRYMVSGRVGLGGFAGHTEALVGLQFQQRAALPDLDGDTIPDAVDACPHDAELRNGYADEDGCPDDLSTVRIKVKNAEGDLMSNVAVQMNGEYMGNTNRDGRLTLPDLMPGSKVQLLPVFEGLEAEPLELMLEEGDNRVDLELGWAPGTLVITAKNLGGTPISAEVWLNGPTEEHWSLDAQGESERVFPVGHYRVMLASEGYDAIIKLVSLPETTGPRQRVDAILRPQRIQLRDDAIVTLDPVLFTRGSFELADASLGLIEAVAAVLVNHPEIKLVEVAGHASAEGTNISNQELSQKRVDEVKRMLVARGVDASRLTAKGYGETQPRADNTTTEGRRRNRRVEFHVLEVQKAPE
ncbi:MAG: OmpA family protein [Alphaproteobacteria bacterium]|nr:OmpA family protein [Alphaproteobacteria bacterium]MCB9694824.1 OmpA family protein [Alphaproteobacteria bacterium]